MTRGADKSYSLREIAERFGGEVLGDPETRVSQVAAVQNAAPGTITFLSNERYLGQLKTTRAAAVILGASARSAVELPRIVCGNPYAVFARVSAFLNPPQAAVPGIHATAVIDPGAHIAADVEIGPLAIIARDAVIGARARIGAGCHVGEGSVVAEESQLHPCVTIYQGCKIGKRAILHSGVVIGADGFGIALENERWIKVPQLGGVTIGDDVEIGANTTIDRGAIDDTVIEEGVKLDNQIQIGHNVRIGAHTAIAACVGIAGSVKIGRHCQIGGGTGIAGHVTIADRVVISGNTSVTKSIGEAGVYSGLYPFESNREWRRNAVHLRHLDELVRRVRALEEKVGGQERSKS